MLGPGDKLDRYTVEVLLGVGGMGSVYQAQDERLGRRVALKVLADSAGGDEERADARARLLREARAAASLDHPNAVHVYDVGEIGGTPYIAMELVRGRTLRSYVGDDTVPVKQRLEWLLAVAHALAAAHDASLVHRDVKPENVIVRADGRVKVLDFGIARRSAAPADPSAPTEVGVLPTLTAKGVPVGTPTYMAPEQIRGEPVDGRTDQFGWAVLAWELLSGRVPWKSHDALSLVAAILTQPAEAGADTLPALPDGVRAVLLRALSKSPADRFASMHDVVRVLEGHVAVATAPSRPPPSTPTDGRRYSNDEIRAILQRALERERHTKTGIGTTELIDAAREVGIEERAVRAALREMDQADDATAAKRRYDRQRLSRAMVMQLVATVVLLGLYLKSGKGVFLLAILISLGAVALRYVKHAFPLPPPPLPRPGARLGERLSREIEDGVSALLTAAGKRLRVASADPTPAPDEEDHEAEPDEARPPPRRAKPR